jgi:tripartite-type tricarboxylate transporter receptor subunit TctC
LLKKRNIIIPSFISLLLVIFFITYLLVSQQSKQNNNEQGKSISLDIATVYEGKSIRFLVPSAPGGGFDEYARLLAPYIEKHTGARVRIANMPGAGGLRVANELFKSPRDGFTIGIMNGSALVTNRLSKLKGANYNLEKFEYLGRVVADTRVLSVSIKSNLNSIEDFLNAQDIIKIGATGLGGTSYVDGVISKEALSLNVKVIHGFDSSPAIRQSMLRGNIAGTWASWSSAEYSVNSGLEKILLQSGTERIKDLPDVPTVYELIGKTKDAEKTKEILTAWDLLSLVGRPVATSPGTSMDKVQFLREAFNKSMHDPAFLRSTEKVNRAVHYASGEEMIEIIKKSIQMKIDIEKLFILAIRGDL